MRTAPLLAALMLTIPLWGQSPAAIAHGSAGLPPPMQRGASDQDPAERLLTTLSELLALSDQQKTRIRSELQHLHEEAAAEQGRHMRQMRSRHQQVLRDLERLLDPHQAELYRAFLRGLELGRPAGPPPLPPRRWQ